MNITPSLSVQQRLREVGIVPTLQRMLIASTLLERPLHMTAEQVLLAVRERLPGSRAPPSTARCNCS